MPLHHPKESQKGKENKINIKLEKLNKIELISRCSNVFFQGCE